MNSKWKTWALIFALTAGALSFCQAKPLAREEMLSREETLSRRLVRATRKGDSVQIRRLVRAGADINRPAAKYYYALGAAFEHHRFGTAELLRSLGADFSRSQLAILNIVSDADLPSLRYVLKRGLKPDSMFNPQGYSLLTYCIASAPFDGSASQKSRRLEALRLLLDAGANPNLIDKMGSGALHDAAQQENLAWTKALLKAGGHVNVPDEDGDTPLILNLSPPAHGPFDSSDSTERRAVRLLLLSEGANVHHRNKRGSAPIHVAVANNFLTGVEDLVKHGADVNARGNGGARPLHIAMRYGWVGAARKLLQLGANPKLKDDAGRSVLDYQTAHFVEPQWELNGESESAYIIYPEQIAEERAKIAVLLRAALAVAPVGKPQ